MSSQTGKTSQQSELEERKSLLKKNFMNGFLQSRGGNMDNNKDELYLDLRDDFFDDETIIAIESLPDGFLYLNILIQMYLISLKDEGKIKNNAVTLSYMTEKSIEDVETAIEIFIDYGIIKIMGDGVIDMIPDDGKLKELVWLKRKDTIG